MFGVKLGVGVGVGVSGCYMNYSWLSFFPLALASGTAGTGAKKHTHSQGKQVCQQLSAEMSIGPAGLEITAQLLMRESEIAAKLATWDG